MNKLIIQLEKLKVQKELTDQVRKSNDSVIAKNLDIKTLKNIEINKNLNPN